MIDDQPPAVRGDLPAPSEGGELPHALSPEADKPAK